MKLQALMESYKDYMRYEQLVSPSTIPVRLSMLNRFRKYMEQQKMIYNIHDIKTHHLRGYISYMRIEEGCQPVSICNVISGLRAFYNFAVQKGVVYKNIAYQLQKPSVEEKEVEYFTWEEVEQLFFALPRNASYLRNLCSLLLFYYSGIRLEEMVRIKVSDLSPDLTELHIERGKGDKARLLPVHHFLQRVLKLYLRSRLQDSVYLFPGKKNDQHISTDRIYRIVKECGERAGIEKRVSPHTFRHSFATHLHQKGVDINRLAQLLGHANIEKTAIYTHIEDEELTAAVSKLS